MNIYVIITYQFITKKKGINMKLFYDDKFKEVLNNTSKNLVFSNNIYKFNFVPLTKFKDLKNSKHYLFLFKTLKKNKIIGINLNWENKNEILYTIKNIINIIEHEKNIYTYKLNLYFYNLNLKNIKFLEEILKIINTNAVIYNIYISSKKLEKKFINILKKYAKFLFVNKKIDNFKNLIPLNKTLNILNNYLILIGEDKSELYKLSEVTRYNTTTQRKRDFIENYPVVSFTLSSKINEYIYIDLFNKKNIKAINDILYLFLDNEKKKNFYSYFSQFFAFIENNTDIVDEEIIIDKDNIEFMKIIILINLLSTKEILQVKNFQEFVNEVEFFSVSKKILQLLLDVLNKYNINLLNNPFIKNIKYKKFN